MKSAEYDAGRASAFQETRELPRQGLRVWRAAVKRHLQPRPGMIVVDIGAGTGAFATAFADWFRVKVLAVEPSPAMRSAIPPHRGVEILEGSAEALPLPHGFAEAAWASMGSWGQVFILHQAG
jgi:ubiquinone/menaquinone biosynthesis C-methylase UbiE